MHHTRPSASTSDTSSFSTASPIVLPALWRTTATAFSGTAPYSSTASTANGSDSLSCGCASASPIDACNTPSSRLGGSTKALDDSLTLDGSANSPTASSRPAASCPTRTSINDWNVGPYSMPIRAKPA
ncbi:hypothetical protein ABL845_15830 [Variovorax sp. NFACC29]